MAREGGRVGKASVESGNVWAEYLVYAVRHTKTSVEEVPTYLVEGYRSVVDIPVLHVDISVRGIRYTINNDLELLGAFLSSFRPNLFSRSVISTADDVQA